VPELASAFTIERQVLYWLKPRAPDLFAPARCPIHLWQFEHGQFFYGFPDLGDGVKVARHHQGATTSADGVSREVSSAEIDDIRALARRFVPGAAGALRKSAVCLYTNTHDEHFWIDRHPQHDRVLIVSPCSGHGFKFTPLIGRILADLATAQPTPIPIERFLTARFA
jgi:sarcosine oxidase